MSEPPELLPVPPETALNASYLRPSWPLVNICLPTSYPPTATVSSVRTATTRAVFTARSRHTAGLEVPRPQGRSNQNFRANCVS